MRSKIFGLLRPAALALCVSSAVASVVLAGDGTVRRRADAVKGEYLVVLRDDVRGVPAVAADLAQKHRAAVKRTWSHAIRGFHAVMTDARAMAMARDPRVEWIEENAEAFLSSTQPTQRVPGCTGSNCTTADNRLWHLDRIDSASPVGPDATYKYCSTGSGVHIYVIDSGVQRSHTEFGSRVRDGFNATGDPDPAYEPCGGYILPKTTTAEDSNWENERGYGGHGTSVASLAAGANTGVAKGAWIVPIKVARCDAYESRQWKANTSYNVGDRVGLYSTNYICVKAGTSGSTAPSFGTHFGNVVSEGPNGPDWETTQKPTFMTTADITEGLDWILGPNNPNLPLQPAVVNFSIYQTTSDPLSALETSVQSLLNAGLIVVASANNQNADACGYSPGRMSYGNTDTVVQDRVITVGGTMIKNNPEVTAATQPDFRGDGGGIGLEPIWSSSATTVDARWVCGAGDSQKCVGAAPGAAPSSNYGPCVTVFAPAKNVTSAILPTASSYRDRLGKWDDNPQALASGTSFSAPIVAGIAALFLQHAPNATSDDFYAALRLNGVYNAMSDAADAPLTGDPSKPSPNLLARAVGVYAYREPANTSVVRNSSATLTFAASGPSVTYQWYRGPAGDTSNPAGTGATVTVTPTATSTYWCRATSTSCSDAVNSVDSGVYTVTVTEPAVQPPATLSATASVAVPTRVIVSWTSVTGAAQYVVQRSSSFAAGFSDVATVTTSTTSYTDNLAAPTATTYVYRVFAVDSAGNRSNDPSPRDYATVATTLFEDEPLTANGSPIRTQHVADLRSAVDAVRVAAGLGPYGWAAFGPANKATDLTSIRTVLDAARAAMQLPAYSYSSTPAVNEAVTTTHVIEMRDSVR